ncbi:hypothetical protein SCATT_p05350 (plasmid) [Streptantibioticus cattleyicolor NRRL 8057 = DSM 46488]|uniref:Uncharacterized protein n=1 Tax=Streptantibioticus cattleyicolor (strain ATCC 35852 / DSM 46488 / JCM 4925 / NBRC 14057 / NRRL 8057) TaxID=1003195 RepID=G8XGH0_STREN|nr:hypothetical protein SCATT_p05350 [Streptantibioticus cattleyicolor NRRL 8057 = DSM 46488]
MGDDAVNGDAGVCSGPQPRPAVSAASVCRSVWRQGHDSFPDLRKALFTAQGVVQ